MKSKTSKEPSIFFVGILGITFALVSFIVFFFLGLPGLDGTSQNLSTGGTIESIRGGGRIRHVGLGLPVRLKIPKIYVNAAIEHVGQTPQGAVGVPKGPENAAWFKLGPMPGDKGSAVIDGHFGWGNGIPAVFDNLHKLEKGDKLYIENDQGMIISFVVAGLKSYDPEQNAMEVFDSGDGKSHLNLITCEGAWDKEQKNYSKRLIVFSVKESEIN